MLQNHIWQNLTWQKCTIILHGKNVPESYMAEMYQNLTWQKFIRILHGRNATKNQEAIQVQVSTICKCSLGENTHSRLEQYHSCKEQPTKENTHKMILALKSQWCQPLLNIQTEKQWEQEDGNRPYRAQSASFLNPPICQNPTLNHHNL